MLLYNIVDQIISSVSGGIRTDDTKFASLRIEDKIDVWRQKALITLYNGNRDLAANKLISPLNYQQFDVLYNPLIQDAGANYIKFELPEPVALNKYKNGYVFLGNKNTGENFTQLKDPSFFSNAKKSKLIDPRKVYWFRTGALYAKFWGNTNLKTFFVDGIIARPLLVPNFDPEITDYPASEEVLDLIFNYAAAELMPQANRVADPINDMRETIEAKKIDPVNA